MPIPSVTHLGNYYLHIGNYYLHRKLACLKDDADPLPLLPVASVLSICIYIGNYYLHIGNYILHGMPDFSGFLPGQSHAPVPTW